MEQAADELARREPIVELDRGAGLLDVDRDAALLEQAKGLWARPKHQLHPSREHDHPTPVVDELFDVGRLDAWHVAGAGLVPIPGAAAAGVELEVLSCSNAFDLDAPPCDVRNARRF